MGNKQEDMSMAKEKQVRDVKGEEKPKDERIQVNPGNTHILTVQLLNSINQNLIELRKEIVKNG